MKKNNLVLPAICLALIPFAAKADTLKDNDTGGSIGPYSMILDGTTNLDLFCMNDKNEISFGEQWNVWVIQGNNLGLPVYGLTSTQITEYEEEAYIYSQFNGTNNTAVQDALWKVFDPGDTVTGTAATYYNNALTNYNTVNLADYDFYIYSGGSITDFNSDKDSRTPQNFIGL